jgi:hypothetical protein
VTDVIEVAVGIAGAVFGAGVSYQALRGEIRAARIASTTAIQQADEALRRIAVERERVTQLSGRIDLADERIANVREKADSMVTAETFKAEMRAQTATISRSMSDRSLPAARPPPPRDERRDDTDPPPMRQRLPSRRDT